MELQIILNLCVGELSLFSQKRLTMFAGYEYFQRKASESTEKSVTLILKSADSISSHVQLRARISTGRAVPVCITWEDARRENTAEWRNSSASS